MILISNKGLRLKLSFEVFKSSFDNSLCIWLAKEPSFPQLELKTKQLAENSLRCQIDNSTLTYELSPWLRMELFPLSLS